MVILLIYFFCDNRDSLRQNSAGGLEEDYLLSVEKKFQFIYLILINKYYPQEICCRISYDVSFQEFKDVCKNLNKEQVEAAFKRFDQTGNEKLNFKEFSDMMTKRSDSKKVKTKTDAGDKAGLNNLQDLNEWWMFENWR